MRSKIYLGIFLVIIIILCFSTPSHSQEPEKSARIISLKGEVFIKSKVMKPKGEWVKLEKANYPLYNGDVVKTEKGITEIEFMDGSIAKLLENTSIGIDEGIKEKKSVGIIKVSLANLWAKAKKRGQKKTGFDSPTVIAGIRGPLDKLQVARVSRFEGEVFTKRKVMKPAGEWVRLKKTNYALYNGDEIKTGRGTAEIEFIDGSTVKLSEKASTGIDVSIY
jgi:hypothetical protein